MLNLILAKAFNNLDPMNWTVIKHSLNFLWKGLLAIFVVIALIIIVVSLTNLCVNKISAAQKARKEAQAAKDDTSQNQG